MDIHREYYQNGVEPEPQEPPELTDQTGSELIERVFSYGATEEELKELDAEQQAFLSASGLL